MALISTDGVQAAVLPTRPTGWVPGRAQPSPFPGLPPADTHRRLLGAIGALEDDYTQFRPFDGGPTLDSMAAFLFREGDRLVLTFEFWREDHVRRHPEHLGMVLVAELPAQELVASSTSRSPRSGSNGEPWCAPTRLPGQALAWPVVHLAWRLQPRLNGWRPGPNCGITCGCRPRGLQPDRVERLPARLSGWGPILRAVTMIYVVEGAQVESLEDFWRVMGEAVNGPGGYFGRNLDAFSDCLRGGFGTPDDDDFIVEWRDHDLSRQHLGYSETVRQLELKLARCHPSNRPSVRADLETARAGLGPTVFDWLMEIFEGEVPGRLRLC